MAPMAEQSEEATATWPPQKLWLFRYVLVVAILAFCNRSLPTSFLPLVLKADFKQPFVLVGIAMAAYPSAALLASGWATRVSLSSQRIIFLHTVALLLMSAATMLFAFSDSCLSILGPAYSMVIVLLLRSFQGVTSALYLSSNTTVITRYFSDSVPYVLGMVEVGVGIGSQLGRMFGGFLYDVGGFVCPFLTLALVQALWGGVGFTIKDDYIAGVVSARQVVRKEVTSLPWSSFVTRRNTVALLGVLSNFLLVGFMDTTLPQHLESRIGPISVGTLSVVMSMRSISYLICSYLLAQVMHRNWMSYERMIALGSFNCILGLALLSPVAFIDEVIEVLVPDKTSLSVVIWIVQILALVIIPSGLAALFIPALPLLQSEVRHLGDQAVEQVAQLFIVAMSLGEAVGPIVGGAAVACVGFEKTTMLFTSSLWLVLIGALSSHNPALAAARSDSSASSLESPLITPLSDRSATQKSFWAADFVDGDSVFRWRRMPYALRQEVGPPGSAPASSCRRVFEKVAGKPKPWESAPASNFRRPYVSAKESRV